MLRMDGFDYVGARSAAEAVELHARLPAAMYVAGGTDLLPNLKHRILRPRNVVGLRGALPRGWQAGEHDGAPAMVIGAGTTLAAMAAGLSDALPPLAQAAGLVAGPQLRNMGTIGGNVLLDTRCLYFNQTAEWRTALGYCLKAEGDWCHVIGGPKTCVAAQSSDCVPVLLTLGASLRLLSAEGERSLPLRDLYRFNGMDHLKLQPGELLTHVVVPLPGPGFRGSYQKLRRRGSIDFPQLGVAIAARFDGNDLAALDVVVGAVNPQPRAVSGLDGYVGRPLDDAAIAAIAERVVKATRPNEAVAGDPDWRRRMAGIYAARGLQALRPAA